MSSVALHCETCGATLFPEATFCEECGARIGARTCAACGAPMAAHAADEYCPVCGVREPAERGRTELNLGSAAAVSDQGLVHRRNDDAFHLESIDGSIVAVVCDGVSTSVAADLAARRAARATGRFLVQALSRETQNSTAAIADAMAAAREAVSRLAQSSSTDLAGPACTLVSAVCRDGDLCIGWLGDSRAYWLSDGEERQLTSDNSWAAEQVAAGVATAVAAAADPRARSITRWVGADSPEAPPQVVTLRPTGSGLLVLCSDGLWNYAPRPSDLARLVRQLPAAASPLAISRWLADTAVNAGGHDNITVAVVDVRLDGGNHHEDVQC